MFFGNVQFLREVWGYSPVWTGLAMAPGPLVVFLLAPWFGRLAGRIGQRPILIPGGVVSAAAALFLLSRVDAAPAYLAVWLPFTLVSAVGVSMVLPLLTSAAVAGLPADRFATGSAVNAALRNLGQTLGVAIFVALAGRTPAGELLAHHRIAWWLVAAAGVAVSATSWRLPRVGSTTRAVERNRHLILLRPTVPIAPAGPATTRVHRVRQGVSS
jgi:MFS family permease